ncbi:MAG: hypothetical protein WD468_02525 [Pirellulales bacterium]
MGIQKNYVPHFAAAIVAALGSAAANAAPVEEKYDNGQIKVRYVEKNGKKNGKYEEFHENGKLKVLATYVLDRLNGAYQTHHENGIMHVAATYRAGKLNGKYIERNDKGQQVLTVDYVNGLRHGKLVKFKDGKPERTFAYRADEIVGAGGIITHPYTRSELAAKLATIYMTRFVAPPAPPAPPAPAGRSAPAARESGPPVKPTEFATEEQLRAVQRLNAYRFLCGAPADVVIDPEYTNYCKAGANLCKKLGRIEHTPKNPGMPEDEYKAGYHGTSNSNLAQGHHKMSEALDGLMDDSDDSNIARVGHRRWCLNVLMQATGFGRTDDMVNQWSLDQRRKVVPKWQMVLYPARGYMPNEYFGDRHAWSVVLNPTQYKIGPDVKAEIYELDDDYQAKTALEFDFSNFKSEESRGTGYALIFRPKKLDMSDGKKYGVQVSGVNTPDGKPTTITYVVEFVDLKAAKTDANKIEPGNAQAGNDDAGKGEAAD